MTPKGEVTLEFASIMRTLVIPWSEIYAVPFESTAMALIALKSALLPTPLTNPAALVLEPASRESVHCAVVGEIKKKHRSNAAVMPALRPDPHIFSSVPGEVG